MGNCKVLLKKVLINNYLTMEKENGTKENPWILKTPPLTSEYTIHRDIRDGMEVLV